MHNIYWNSGYVTSSFSTKLNMGLVFVGFGLVVRVSGKTSSAALAIVHMLFANLYLVHPQATNSSLCGAFFCSGVCSFTSSSPSVIVIGGAIAGLAAARALQKASFKVGKHS